PIPSTPMPCRADSASTTAGSRSASVTATRRRGRRALPRFSHMNETNDMTRLHPLIDPIAGRALSFAGEVALSSWASYRMLFVPPLVGDWRERLAHRRAAAAFARAKARVPAYREFLQEHGALGVAAFEDIPPMDKAGYIVRWPLEELCVGGQLPERGAVIDESSGSSGAASNWVRGAAERRSARRLLQYSSRSCFGDDSFILLNTFALGPWATGMNVSMSLVDRCVLKSIGPDVAKSWPRSSSSGHATGTSSPGIRPF